jgi:putative transposase
MTIQDILYEGLPLSASRSCRTLGVSRNGYRKWLKRTPSAASENCDNMHLTDLIQKIALDFPGYGYRRMTAELQNRGYAVNEKRILRLMRQDNLLCLKKKFKPITTDSSHGLPVYPNLLKSIRITARNQVWASDITYILLLHENIYLAVILDPTSRTSPFRHSIFRILCRATL